MIDRKYKYDVHARIDPDGSESWKHNCSSTKYPHMRIQHFSYYIRVDGSYEHYGIGYNADKNKYHMLKSPYSPFLFKPINVDHEPSDTDYSKWTYSRDLLENLLHQSRPITKSDINRAIREFDLTLTQEEIPVPYTVEYYEDKNQENPMKQISLPGRTLRFGNPTPVESMLPRLQ